MLFRPGSSLAAGPLGGESPPPGERRVEVTAQRITREVERNTTIAEGAVDILSGTLHLKADRVELNDLTMDITATGNVVVEMGKDRLQGELLKFNLRTEEGYVVKGQGFAQEYYFTGERIEKTSANRYHVVHGSFTSCEGVLPDWSFHSTDATIDVNDYIYSWNPTLWVKWVPVFYLPYAVVPIKRDRATGLLVPRIRFHQTDGLIISNSLFWAPVDNADATLSLDYFSRRGWRPGLELNYVLDEETNGYFQGSFIDDRQLHGNQWDLQFTHRHALPWGIDALAKIDYTNEEQYYRDYGETLEDQSQEKLDSYISFAREWGNDTTLTLSSEHLQSLVSTQKTTFDRLPELNLQKVDGRIGDGPIFWALRAQAVGLREKTGDVEQETFRFDLAPKISWPVNVQSWATAKPSVGIDYTYYTNNTQGNADDRFLYNPRFELTGPKFYRIFGDSSGGSRFKHIVTPRVTYNYLPDVDQKDLPKFDSLDRVSPSNAVAYGLANQVLGKFPAEEGGRPVVREVFWLDLSQAYNLSPVKSGAERKYLGDLRGNLRFTPLTNLLFEANAAYDFTAGALNEDNYQFSWGIEKVGGLSLDRRHSRPSKVDYLEGSINVLPGRWSLTYRGRYDLEDSTFVENSVEVKYAAQCWDVTVTYVKHQDAYEYKFLLNFKEIGTIIQF